MKKAGMEANMKKAGMEVNMKKAGMEVNMKKAGMKANMKKGGTNRKDWLAKVVVLSKKDLIRIIKNESFLFVILSQILVISLTVSTITTFPQILSGARVPERMMSLAVVGNEEFLSALGDLNIALYRYDSIGMAAENYDLGYHYAIVECDFHPEGTEPILVRVYVPKDVRSSILISRLKDVLNQREKEIRTLRAKKVRPDLEVISIEEIPSESRESALIFTLLLPLFFLSTVVLAGTLMINILSHEIERKTIETLLAAPISRFMLAFSKSLTCIILVPVQVLLWIIVLAFNGFRTENVIPLLILSVSYAMVFTSLALIAVLIAKRRDPAQNIFTLALIPAFAFLLPVSEQSIEPLGFLINLIPVYLISRLSFGLVSQDVWMGILLTMGSSLILFIFSHRMAERWL